MADDHLNAHQVSEQAMEISQKVMVRNGYQLEEILMHDYMIAIVFMINAALHFNL